MSRLAAAGAIPLNTSPTSAGGPAPAPAGGSARTLKADNKTLAIAGGVVFVGVVLYQHFTGGSTSSPATLDTTSSDLDQLSADLEAVNAQMAAFNGNMSKTPKPAPKAKTPAKPKPVKHAVKPKPHKAVPRPPHPAAPKPAPKKRRPVIKKKPAKKPASEFLPWSHPVISGGIAT